MKDENYWSLVIGSGFVQSGIWKIEDSSVDILSVSKSRKWDEHELVEVADAVLSGAIKNFPEHEKEPSKTVFGVPPNWVESGQIKKDYLEKIRKICVDLSLSPSGFVVMPEAISHAIKVQEGSPLSGIVIGIGDKTIDVSLFKLGNLVGTVNVGKSVSPIDDIVEGLVRFSTKDAFPTRIILYGSEVKELEDTKQQIIKAEWPEKAGGKVKFMHLPQIEILSDKEQIISLSVSGASEMANIESVTFAGESVDANANQTNQIQANEESNITPSKDLTAEDIGFVIDEDITEQEESEFASANIKNNDTPFSKSKKAKFSFLKLHLPFSRKKKSIPNRDITLGKINKHPSSVVKKIAIIMVALLLFAAAGLSGAWIVLPKAEIAVFVSPKTLEEAMTLVLDENLESANIEEMVFPIKKISREISGDKSKQTTGTKTVGERAKGTVTIRNGTSKGINFAVGTRLTGPGDLEFSLDESASVSAALSPLEPGSVTVAATAVDIGADYNLASSESLSVGNYPKSEVDAIVEQSFSGGSSTEIIAVSQTDLNTLSEELKDELKRKGLSELESQAVDMLFIIDSLEVTVQSQDFSNSVGDEASTVSLSMTVEVVGLAIDNQTIDQLSEAVLADQVPNGFKLKREQVDVIFELIEDLGKGKYEFDVSLSANLLPEVDIEDIISNVSGKYPPRAKSFLQTIPGFSSAEVSISPRFPGRLGIIPFSKDKISVDIVAER